MVMVGRVQMQQVLINLIRNAIDAMAGSARKYILIQSEPYAHGFVRVGVEDSGTGIETDVAARLFEPFQTTKDTGMGLGLSICRTIVEAQGGTIWAEPALNGGTIFYFTLPRADLEERDD